MNEAYVTVRNGEQYNVQLCVKEGILLSTQAY
jgi:hypothetical protein